MNYQILQGDNRDSLKSIPDNSIDAIVTDPPYGIDFLGKTWDANTGALETYQECLRVLKPGGHILAFSAARTYHHLAVTLEQAGFEIRDQIMWIYSSGFPKSQDIGKSIARSENKLKNTKTYMPSIDDNRNVANSTTGSPRCQKCDSSGWVGRNTCSREDCIKPWQADRQDNAWNGWGTQLKPAHEPIALARKPIKLSIAKNCQQWGVGALNIDATRVPYDDPAEAEADAKWRAKWGGNQTGGAPVFQGTAVRKIDKPKGARASMQTGAPQFQGSKTDTTNKEVTWEASQIGRFPSNVIGEISDYQKYFYCPKVSRRERHMGFDSAPDAQSILNEMGAYFVNDQGDKVEYEDRHNVGMVYVPYINTTIPFRHIYDEYTKWKKSNNNTTIVGNNHPTVKPIELMKYLIKLVTPPGGTVLDPFNGSGSTGCAAVELGHPYIGCELDPNYVAIAKTRIAAWYQQTQPKTNPTVEELFDCPDFYQIFSSKYPYDSTQ